MVCVKFAQWQVLAWIWWQNCLVPVWKFHHTVVWNLSVGGSWGCGHCVDYCHSKGRICFLITCSSNSQWLYFLNLHSSDLIPIDIQLSFLHLLQSPLTSMTHGLVSGDFGYDPSHKNHEKMQICVLCTLATVFEYMYSPWNLRSHESMVMIIIFILLIFSFSR